MKTSRIVDLHVDAGWRVFSFLKIETDAGLIGWSESENPIEQRQPARCSSTFLMSDRP